MKRRDVRLHSYDEVLADVDSLLANGYDRAGNWGLGQACHHLAAVMEMSLDGFPFGFPRPLRALARWFALKSVLNHRRFKRRFPAPKGLLPPAEAGDAEGADRLRAAVARLQAHTGALQPSPVFGDLTPEQWREVHLWHCEHHLSFLLPKPS